MTSIPQRHLRTEPLPALVQKIWLPGWCILGRGAQVMGPWDAPGKYPRIILP